MPMVRQTLRQNRAFGGVLFFCDGMLMRTRQSVLNAKHIVVSVCWYGRAQLYYDGMVTLLDRLANWRRSWKVTCVLVHTDGSLPTEWREAVAKYDTVRFVDGTPGYPPLMWRFFDAAKADVHIAVDLDEDIIDILQRFERCWIPHVCHALLREECLLVSHMARNQNQWNYRDLSILLPANLIIFVNAKRERVFSNMRQQFSDFVAQSSARVHADEMDDDAHPITREARPDFYLIDEVFFNAWALPRLSATTRLVRMRLRGENLRLLSRVDVETMRGLDVARALR